MSAETAPTKGPTTTAMRDTTFAVVDVQTTGLYPDRGDRICEIAVVRMEGDRPASEWHTLIQPLRRMSIGARRLSGISDEDLRSAPTLPEVASALWSRLSGSVLVAHNAAFEVGFLASELGPLGLPVESLLAVDTMALARRYLAGDGYDLSSLARRVGIDDRESHRALPNARLAASVLGRFVRMLGHDGAPLMDLLPRRADGRLRSPDPFGKVLLSIEEAIARHAALSIRYDSPWSSHTTERSVDPLCVSDDFYLEAFCHLRGAPRRFRIDRIKSASVLASAPTEAAMTESEPGSASRTMGVAGR